MAGLVALYFGGVLLGCWRGDAPPLKRIGLALLWPLAPVACVLTLSVLALAAVLFFPAVGVIALGAALAGWIYWR